MSTVLSHFDCPSSILTPSTIQCTQFYVNNNNRKNNSSINLFEHIKRYAEQKQQTTKTTTTKTTISPSSTISSSLTSLSLPPIKLLNRHTETFGCLDKQLAENLQQWLPCRISVLSTWSLVYSLDQHGASLSTIYRRFNTMNEPCLLIIQNTEEEMFGAYLTHGFTPQQSYYGTGECFLWKTKKKKTNQQDEDEDEDEEEEGDREIEVFPWTGHNDYLMYCNPDFLAVGGGQGKFGLWLDADLTHGYSEPCMTFNNPSLSSSRSFECLAIEIWRFAY